MEKQLDFSRAINPTHYNRLNPEPKDVIRSWGLNFNLGNAVKYIARAGHKDDVVQDLKKAQEYIKFEIEAIEAERNKGEAGERQIKSTPNDNGIVERTITGVVRPYIKPTLLMSPILTYKELVKMPAKEFVENYYDTKRVGQILVQHGLGMYVVRGAQVTKGKKVLSKSDCRVELILESLVNYVYPYRLEVVLN